MRMPTVDSVQCPDCGRTSTFFLTDYGLYYLADERWSCPYCKSVNTTETIQKHNEKKSD